MLRNEDQPLQPVFEVPHQKVVNTDQGEIDVHEFAKKEGFIWVDAPVTAIDVKKHLPQDPKEVEEALMKSQLEQIFIDMGKPQPKEITRNIDSMLHQLGITKARLNDLNNEYEKEITSTLKKSTNKLVIRTINKIVNKGVFLAPNSLPIKKGEIVCIYPGEYLSKDPTDLSFHSYGLEVMKHFIFAKAPGFPLEKGFIDAERYGNISRYFNDMPTAQELAEWYNVNPKIAKEIATANLEMETGYYQNYPIAHFKALNDITGQLGFSYRMGYWAKAEYVAGIERCLFKKDGAVVNRNDYKCRFLNLAFEVKDRKTQFFPMLIKDIKQHLKLGTPLEAGDRMSGVINTFNTDELVIAAARKIFKAEATKEELYKVKFCVTVRIILLNFSVDNAYGNNELTKQKIAYVKKLEESIINLSFNNADETYKNLQKTLTDDHLQGFYKEHLLGLKREIISSMVAYNAAKTAKQAQHNTATTDLESSAKKLSVVTKLSI